MSGTYLKSTMEPTKPLVNYRFNTFFLEYPVTILIFPNGSTETKARVERLTPGGEFM